MHIEIDQSGKIEQYLDAIVAFRNKEQYSVLLKRKLKVALLTEYRNKYKDLTYRLFAILIYYCIRDYLLKYSSILIDTEYEGRDIDIKKHLLRFIQKDYPRFDKKIIKFGRIGKNSRAHSLAYKTYAEKLAPNKILTKKEMEELL